jgi:hypothetical protein
MSRLKLLAKLHAVVHFAIVTVRTCPSSLPNGSAPPGRSMMLSRVCASLGGRTPNEGDA